MKQFVSKIWNSTSARNVGKLLSANVFAQALGLLVYPILTRIYSPEDFGLLNLFLSIGGILAMLATSEYQSAILLPSREDEAAGVARVAFIGVGLWSLLITATIPLARPISFLFKTPELANYYGLIVVYVAVMGCWAVYNVWLMRRRMFGSISAFQLNQSAIGVLMKMLFGLIGWMRSGLILSSLLAPFIALITAIGYSRKVFREIWQKCNDTPWQLAKRYRRFPLFSMPRSLINNLSGNLPALLLTPYFGLNELGFFAMAMTLSFRPVSMITASLYQVLFERVAQAVRKGECVFGTLRRRWVQMAAVIVPSMILLTFFMPWLVRVLLGEGWNETATLIRYMIPWIACVFLISPLAFISEVFGKQKLFLLIEIAYLLLRVIAMVVGIWMDSFKWAIVLMSASGTIVLLFQLICYIHILRQYESSRLTQAGK